MEEKHVSGVRRVYCRKLLREPKQRNRGGKMKTSNKILVSIGTIVFFPVVFVGVVSVSVKVAYLFGKALALGLWKSIR